MTFRAECFISVIKRSFFMLFISMSVHLLSTQLLLCQDFVKVTDATNPVASDPGSPDNSYTGCSWIDYNSDGLLDLFVNRKTLYRNAGAGAFVRETSLLSNQGNSTGNSWADVDNDGDLDCFVTGGSVNVSFLYRNDGNNSFTKITSGDIGNSATNTGWACAWADYNNDGFVDLVITEASRSHPNRFFQNNGDGTFARIDTGAVVTGLSPYTVPSWSDYDHDGDVDLFIGSGPVSTKGTDFLFQNMLKETGTAFFKKITTSALATDTRDGQLFNWIDYDNDGDLDVYITNLSGTGGASGLANDLYRNDNGTFIKMNGAQVGTIVTDAELSLGSVWADYDNDGDLDCFVNNDSSPTSRNTNRYYRNNGDGTFTRLDNLAMVSDRGNHFGATAGDYDNDGDIDLYVAGPASAKGLYRNNLNNDNAWINIRGVGTTSNRAAIGTRVRVKATINGVAVWQLREISSQNCFNGQSMLNVHFGLGNGAMVDSLVIDWPRGRKESYTQLAVNQFLTVTEDGGITGVDDRDGHLPDGFALHQNYPNPFNPNTKIRYHLPGAQFVTLKVYDLSGREVAILANGRQAAGFHEIDFDASSLASGVYFYRLQTGGFHQIRRMVLIH